MSLDVAMATVSLGSGLVLAGPNAAGAARELEELAAIVPEIFGTLELSCLGRVAERLGIAGSGEEQIELLLLSDSRVQVVQALSESPELALVAVSSGVDKIGLVLSLVRARVTGGEGLR